MIYKKFTSNGVGLLSSGLGIKFVRYGELYLGKFTVNKCLAYISKLGIKFTEYVSLDWETGSNYNTG